MENSVKFAIEDINNFLDDEDVEMAIANVEFLSTRPNSHEIEVTEEILRRDASTILGKWLIGEYDELMGDVTTHTSNQKILGIIPKDAEVKFEYDDDGYLVASVNAVVSKLYATETYNLFKSKNRRSVSVEMTTYGEDGKKIDGLVLRAITVLGLNFNPSVPNANIQIIRFSEDNANKYYNEQMKVSKLERFAQERKYKVNKKEVHLELKKEEKLAVKIDDLYCQVYGKLEDKYPDKDWGSIYRICGIYEDGTQKFAIVYRKDEVQKYRLDFAITETDGLVLGDDLVEVVEEFKETGEIKKFEAKEEEKKTQEFVEEEKKEEPAKEDEEEKEEEKLSSDANVDPSAMESMLEIEAEKNKDLADKLAEKDNIIMGYEEELSALRKFKEEILEEKKVEEVSSVLAQIKETVDKESYEKFEETGKLCKFEEVTAWKNEVLASVATNILKMSNKNDRFRMGLDKEVKTKSSLWDRL